MCFPRKPGLGHYAGTKAQWRTAYRAARVAQREGREPDPKTKGLTWKASLVVAFERGEWVDPLAMPLRYRALAWQVVNEILAESA